MKNLKAIFRTKGGERVKNLTFGELTRSKKTMAPPIKVIRGEYYTFDSLDGRYKWIQNIWNIDGSEVSPIIIADRPQHYNELDLNSPKVIFLSQTQLDLFQNL